MRVDPKSDMTGVPVRRRVEPREEGLEKTEAKVTVLVPPGKTCH